MQNIENTQNKESKSPNQSKKKNVRKNYNKTKMNNQHKKSNPSEPKKTEVKNIEKFVSKTNQTKNKTKQEKVIVTDKITTKEKATPRKQKPRNKKPQFKVLSRDNYELKIFALGGLGEIGKNMYCIETKDQLFVIDCGFMFPDQHLLGVDYVLPNFDYLVKNQEKIVGLFITHGHEDHIGGIPFLLKQINLPAIYASGLAKDLIELKFKEHSDVRKPKIINFNSDDTFRFRDISMSFIRINHSIPDAYSFVFDTPIGKIVHTGDFKIDLTPAGPKSELSKLAKVGEEGVICLLEDSTNALTPGYNESEAKIGKSIDDLFDKIDGRVIVATFASNMFRCQQIVESSVKHGRKIAIFGRSMEKTIDVGTKIGYIKAPEGSFIDGRSLGNYKSSKVTILCTGSQGEPLAALSRVASGTHRQIKLNKGDTVIFSSSPIPGNQEGINKTINLLFKKGAKVIVHSPLTDTHTSGHATQGELTLMLSLIKPEYFIPIHGEYRMQRVHSQLAISTGVEKDKCFIMHNGDVLTFKKTNKVLTPSLALGAINADKQFVDGRGIGDTDMELISERRVLSDDGVFSVIFTIDKANKKVIGDPQIVSRGFIYMKTNEKLINLLKVKSLEFLSTNLEKNSNYNEQRLSKQVRDFLGKLIKEETSRQPMILPVFMAI